MIRHVHHAKATYAPASRTASSAASKKSTQTDSFRTLLSESTQAAPAAATVAQIKATVVKEAAKPTVTLSAPSFEIGPTVTNPDGSLTALNYTQFADASTAKQIAAKLGGTVSESTINGYSTGQRSISVPGSPNLINAGIAAQLFAQYGDKQGSAAWQIINRDLGRDPMST